MDHKKNTISIFDKFAAKYQEKYMDLEAYRDSLDLFCAHLENKQGKILDIGCGPGNLSRYIKGKCPHIHLLGIDLSAKMLELARINNPDDQFVLMDCRDIVKIKLKFDGVLCGFCLPYLSREDALHLISDVSGLLMPGGIFYLSTMEDDYEKSGLEGSDSGVDGSLYIYYHQSDYLLTALRESRYEILDLKRRPLPENKNSSTMDLVILARRREETWDI